ncbi:MAG: dihydrolipoyl dehydrogenase [Desulfobacterales bacterium]|nr:MAG: dihydrolipoyl dehydrogenase [Desulfobacterales bacterium]
MPVEITIPKFGLTMTEARILEWKKKEGDDVKKGEVLFLLETEKIIYEFEAPEDGRLAKILVPEDETVSVGTVVACLLRSGESLQDLKSFLIAEKLIAEAAEKSRPRETAASEAGHTASASGNGGIRVKASPKAKKAARLLNVDLKMVTGTGPGGRILEEDVQKAAESASAVIVSKESDGVPVHDILPLSGMRLTIAKKMLASKTTTAQTYMTHSVDAGQILAFRENVLPLIEQTHGVRVTITDILMKITAVAIKEHPVINTRWTDEGIMIFKDVHMGMAMALEDGLIVPVIRDIDEMDLPQVALKRQALVEMGKSRKFLPDDISGSTFTLSTLGMFDVDHFTANINLPETAILAVGAIKDKPVAIDKEVVIRPMMNVTLSYDHRVIDGAVAAKFMKTLRTSIENPVSVFESTPRVEAAPAEKRVTVIGGGVAGYSAAIVAARLGAKVTLIEKDHLGGVCLNRGCIPTKSMLHACEITKTLEAAADFGIMCDSFRFDFKKIMNRKNSVTGQLRSGVEKLLAARKVRVVNAAAVLVDASTVEIPDTRGKICSDAIIIATGSTPRRLNIEGADIDRVWDSNDFLKMKRLPKSAAIIGGGYIGVEFAQILHGLGVDVTILEYMENLVPGVDTEIALALEQSMLKEGIKVFAGARVEKIRHTKGKSTVHFTWQSKQKKCVVGRVISAVGRQPDLAWLDPDKIGLARKNGALFVNERMETNIRGIYAAGDAVGGIMLAHVAAAEGECAAKNIMGQKNTVNYKAVPACIYTTPEVASVGLTEAAARQKCDIRIGRFPFMTCGKALILNQTYGMVKIICEAASGKVLGVHIIGPHATNLIGEAVLGMSMNMNVEQLARGIHPHPSLSEAVMEAAMSLCEGAIHLP